MPRSLLPRLQDIIEAAERIQLLMDGVSLDAFEADWQKQWLVERGIEIVSEASRHLTDELKSRHPEIPWKKVAGIGNIFRHDYGNIAAPVLWALVQDHLPSLLQVCLEEFTAERNNVQNSDGGD